MGWLQNKIDSIKSSVNESKAKIDGKIRDKIDKEARKEAGKQREKESQKTLQQRQKQFEDDYKAMNDEFGNSEIQSSIQTCLVKKNKAERRKQRKEKIRKAKEKANATNDKEEKKRLNESADRLDRNTDQVEYARAAKHVYLKNDPNIENMPDNLKSIANTSPEGMVSADDKDLQKLGLKQSDLTPEGSSFKAAVYKKDPSVWGNTEDEYIVAFRGSTTSDEDWINNFRQGANEESEYYKRAINIGEKLNQSPNGKNVQLVGHSLGGGLASAASGGGNLNASTFNSAGLNKKTLPRYAANSGENVNENIITAFRIKGEVLTKSQEKDFKRHFLPKAAGNKVDLEPHDSSLSSDDKHDMDNVIFAIEKEKSADEKFIDDAIML